MQTVVNFHGGFHLNVFPVILAALIFFVVIYLITGKKTKKPAEKEMPSRKDTYDFMYSQLLDKKAS